MANICFIDSDWRLWHFLHNLRHSRCFLGLNQELHLGASFILRQNFGSEGSIYAKKTVQKQAAYLYMLCPILTCQNRSQQICDFTHE